MWIRSLALLVLLPACAHLRGTPSEVRERAQLWEAAHQALSANEFGRADTLFSSLVQRYPDSDIGRESLFYLGALHLDPRNPNWNPEPAESVLRRYLAADTSEKVEIYRRPEGDILLELARQLNLPPEQRISALQPEVKTVRTPPQRIVRYRESQELAQQVSELRRQVDSRDAQIRRLQEELERIRKTLTRPRQE